MNTMLNTEQVFNLLAKAFPADAVQTEWRRVTDGMIIGRKVAGKHWLLSHLSAKDLTMHSADIQAKCAHLLRRYKA